MEDRLCVSGPGGRRSASACCTSVRRLRVAVVRVRRSRDGYGGGGSLLAGEEGTIITSEKGGIDCGTVLLSSDEAAWTGMLTFGRKSKTFERLTTATVGCLHVFMLCPFANYVTQTSCSTDESNARVHRVLTIRSLEKSLRRRCFFPTLTLYHIAVASSCPTQIARGPAVAKALCRRLYLQRIYLLLTYSLKTTSQLPTPSITMSEDLDTTTFQTVEINIDLG